MRIQAGETLNGYGRFWMPGPNPSVVDREVHGVAVIDLTGSGLQKSRIHPFTLRVVPEKVQSADLRQVDHRTQFGGLNRAPQPFKPIGVVGSGSDV